MGEWNYNQYSGYPWEGNRGAQPANTQSPQSGGGGGQPPPTRQYVGFQEFLSQYQQYPMNYAAAQYQYPSARHYSPAANSDALQMQAYAPANAFQYDNSYGDVNSRLASVAISGQAQNQTHHFNNNASFQQSTQFGDSNAVASTSKLTPTAEEFVPSSSRPDTSNVVHANASKPEKDDVENGIQNKTTPPVKSPAKNVKKNGNQPKKSANWRDREGEVEEMSYSNIPSVVIENKSDRQAQKDTNRSKGRDANKSKQNDKNSANDKDRNPVNNKEKNPVNDRERNSAHGRREKSSANDRDRNPGYNERDSANDKDRNSTYYERDRNSTSDRDKNSTYYERDRNSANDRDKNSTYYERERTSANDRDRNSSYYERERNYTNDRDRNSSYGERDRYYSNDRERYNERNRGRGQNSDYNNDSSRNYRTSHDDRGSGRIQRSYDDYDNGDSYRGGYYQNGERSSRNQNSNSEYHDEERDGSKYNSRSKSYMTNETFRQKGYSNNNYGNRENEPEYNNYARGNGGKGRKEFFNPSLRRDNSAQRTKDIDGVEVSQRDRLTEQLNKGALECLVCCERIKQTDSVWSCANCFHVLHLSCTIRWAKSSMAEGAWRCPACQNQNSLVPAKYLCFCGKRTNPEWSRGGDGAHTCGDTCGRLPASCLRHPCTLLCHAGPCPQCDAVVAKKCECGATSQSLRCSHAQPLLCDKVCDKALNCKNHRCKEKCHAGACSPCQETVDQECFCPAKTKRTLPCDVKTVGVFSFSCEGVCDRKLECGNHNCTKTCHDKECDKCRLLPEFVKRCPCGQTLLTAEQKRESCLDPIPVCDKICSKVFECGPPEARHACQKPCHPGDCPPCPLKTVVPCRCGHINNPLPCVKLEEERDKVRCKKKCSKKQSCVRHRCKTLCCVDLEHRCPLPCNRMLTCGLHKCEDTCHSGHCDPCWRTGFDELRCRCGAAVRYPPIPCGTRPPLCDRPCSIPRPCGHEPLHPCHPEPSACTPCTVLTQRHCHGRHRLRKTIPCHQEEFSCGLPCGRELPCGKHKCIETCHKGSCPSACNQQCEAERLGCGHPCGAACAHPSPCPVAAPCKRPVNVACLCGRRTAVKACADHMRDLQRIQATTGMLEGTMGQPVDIKALIEKGNTTTTLDCDDECYVEERNRRMAIGLQIRNPDVSSKLTPRYSDFMKQFFTRDESFCVKVHEKLTELVLLAQKSKQKTRSHSFQPMNHLKRQFVHEYCDHFGCESKAYDSEPYRNIVATAFREKSWLPALSLMEVVRRDKGQRRVPGPIVGSNAAQKSSMATTSVGGWSTLGGNYSSAASEASKITSVEPEPPRRPKIDYFDAPPED